MNAGRRTYKPGGPTLALSDPQTVTIGTARTEARVLTGERTATYAEADGSSSLRIDHQVTRTRKRSLIQLTRKMISTDPLTDIKSEISASVNITFDRPLVGFTEAQLLELITGATGWGSASTNANYKAVLAMQS
jgi:hypothetical protein